MPGPGGRNQVRRAPHGRASRRDAFAVSGFAGAINPDHELRVKRRHRGEPGSFATCGHELSDTLDFQTRRHGRAEREDHPRIASLLLDLEEVRRHGVDAPVFGSGDGTLMSAEMAKRARSRPSFRGLPPAWRAPASDRRGRCAGDGHGRDDDRRPPWCRAGPAQCSGFQRRGAQDPRPGARSPHRRPGRRQPGPV